MSKEGICPNCFGQLEVDEKAVDGYNAKVYKPCKLCTSQKSIVEESATKPRQKNTNELLNDLVCELLTGCVKLLKEIKK